MSFHSRRCTFLFSSPLSISPPCPALRRQAAAEDAYARACREIKGRHVFLHEPWDPLWPTNTLRDISNWITAGGEQLSLWAGWGICYDKQTKSQLSPDELGVTSSPTHIRIARCHHLLHLWHFTSPLVPPLLTPQPPFTPPSPLPPFSLPLSPSIFHLPLTSLKYGYKEKGGKKSSGE